MAKVADVFLNGSMGNVVFYRRMGTKNRSLSIMIFLENDKIERSYNIYLCVSGN
jgi:hypothetical protein